MVIRRFLHRRGDYSESGFPDRLLEAKKKGALTREDMEKAARNVLRLILRID